MPDTSKESSSVEEVSEHDSSLDDSEFPIPVIDKEAENSQLLAEIAFLHKEIEKYKCLLSFTKRYGEEDNMDWEEILPWSYEVTKLLRRKLASDLFNEHVFVFKKFLRGFAFCIDVANNGWLWYDWNQRLWVFSSGEEMLPLITKLINELVSKRIPLSDKLTTDFRYLYDLIVVLKTELLDFGDVQGKIDSNTELIPISQARVVNVDSKIIRMRRKEDYFSFFYDKGKIKFISRNTDIKINRTEKNTEYLRRFFEEIISPFVSKGEKIFTKDLYNYYVNWCKRKQIIQESKQRLGKFLTETGFERKRFRDGFYWMDINPSFL